MSVAARFFGVYFCEYPRPPGVFSPLPLVTGLTVTEVNKPSEVQLRQGDISLDRVRSQSYFARARSRFCLTRQVQHDRNTGDSFVLQGGMGLRVRVSADLA